MSLNINRHQPPTSTSSHLPTSSPNLPIEPPSNPTRIPPSILQNHRTSEIRAQQKQSDESHRAPPAPEDLLLGARIQEGANEYEARRREKETEERRKRRIQEEANEYEARRREKEAE